MPGMVTSVVVGGKWQSGTEETNDQSRRKKNTGKKSKNNMLNIIPKQVDPDMFKLDCKSRMNVRIKKER